MENKAPMPIFGRPQPTCYLHVELFPDGHAESRGPLENPVLLMVLVKAALDASVQEITKKHQNGLVVPVGPVRPIKNGPNGTHI